MLRKWDARLGPPRPAGAASLRFPVAAAVLVIVIFVLDTITDKEIAIAVLYVAVVLMSVTFCRRRGVVLVSGACMGLTALSYLITTTGEPRSGLVNCMISLLAIAATAYLALKIESAEVAAREARAQLAHFGRVATLGELTASIAHEVIQPMAAVVTSGNACLRWLDSRPPNLEKARQAIERIVNDANRASGVIHRVRSLASRSIPQREQLNINEIIQEIVALTYSEIQRHDIALRTQLSEDLPPVPGDRIQLQQVVLNLIVNAVEAINGTAEGARELLISSARNGARAVLVAVHDSGAGLGPGDPEELFLAFHTSKPDGMGMGLAISRSIIEAHGGRVWATSSNGPGAVFQFTLPTGER